MVVDVLPDRAIPQLLEFFFGSHAVPAVAAFDRLKLQPWLVILAALKHFLCYNERVTFGKGSILRQLSPKLRNTTTRQRIILDRAERNSVIEGLPPFTEQTKKECLKELNALGKR